MSIPKLTLDKRFTTNGGNSHIDQDNAVKLHVWIPLFLKEYSKVLPVYANDAAAVAAGLVSGDMYKTAAGALMFVN